MIEKVNFSFLKYNKITSRPFGLPNYKIIEFKLTEVGDRYLAFKGVSDGAHRSLSYQRSEEDIFFIEIETNVGERIEIKLTPIM